MTGMIALLAAAAVVPDADLAEMRGGFALPSGLDVAIAVQTDTKVDGALLLRTVSRLDQGAPTVTVEAPDGAASQSALSNGQRVSYQGDRIDVTHLVGSAIGSVVANSANDRTIDTATTLSLSIGGATPDNLGSAMLRVNTLALDATASMLGR